MKSRDEAIAEAKKLLSIINTPGWVIRVWENLGWHYAIENSQGMITVYPSYPHDRHPIKYYCMMTDNEKFPGCGSPIWADDHHYLDPNDAIAMTTQLAREKVDELNNLVKRVERDLRGG